MVITHRVDEILFDLFPRAKAQGKSLDLLREEIQSYYTFGPYIPEVLINSDFIEIHIDTPSIVSEGEDYQRAVRFSEMGKYEEAKLVLKKLISKNPSNSEYHRIYGQILSEQGDQDNATNSLIDALRWNPKNKWALIMMGNIFAKYKEDIPTALKYYEKAIDADPNDNIAVNNIGANLLNQGKIEEAKKYFFDALAINNDYPNTHYALSLIATQEGDHDSAFFSASQAVKKSNKKDPLYKISLAELMDSAKMVIKKGKAKSIVTEFRHKLEFDSGKEIEIIAEQDIPTAAKIEFAENYNREKHIVKYNPNYKAIEHLIMHELMHLHLVIDARKNKVNQLFTTNQFHRAEFIKTLTPTMAKLKRSGIPETSIASFSTGLFEGISRQIYNGPIDLFIEKDLYQDFPDLRAYQFISLMAMVEEGRQAVTNKKVVEVSPKDVLSKSKILNLVNAIQLRDLYGVDLVDDFNASTNEINQAQAFYDEFVEYRDDKEPGEEYELVLHWGEDLKLEKYFELVSEENFRRKSSGAAEILQAIENDPFDLENTDLSKKHEMETFQKTQQSIGTNLAVVMFMVDALQYFEDIPKEKIKEIAFEIALTGTQGIAPDKKGYRVSKIPEKTFSGYHLLAFYYVSWKLAIPEMLAQLKLPYDEEFKLAETMHKPKSE